MSFLLFCLFVFYSLSCIYFQEPPSLSLYLFQIQTAVSFSHYLSNFQMSPLFLSLYHALSFLFKRVFLSLSPWNASSLYLKCSLLSSTAQSICLSLSFLYIRLLSVIFKCFQSYFQAFASSFSSPFSLSFSQPFETYSLFFFRFFLFHNVSSLDFQMFVFF